jgi:hypothetical protein
LGQGHQEHRPPEENGMSKFNVDKELKKVERELIKVGARMSKPFVKRAKELIVELSKFKGVKLHHLIMGMGGWHLEGEVPFKEYWGENLSKVEEGVHEFDFDHFGTRSNWSESHENVNPGICEVAIELDEILERLTNEPYLTIFDISEAEMKKLLKSA